MAFFLKKVNKKTILDKNFRKIKQVSRARAQLCAGAAASTVKSAREQILQIAGSWRLGINCTKFGNFTRSRPPSPNAARAAAPACGANPKLQALVCRFNKRRKNFYPGEPPWSRRSLAASPPRRSLLLQKPLQKRKKGRRASKKSALKREAGGRDESLIFK